MSDMRPQPSFHAQIRLMPLVFQGACSQRFAAGSNKIQLVKTMNDPISDLLIRIKNAYMARKVNVEIPHSKMKEGVIAVLNRHGYIGKIEIIKDGAKKTIKVDLVYDNKTPKFTNVEIVSTPGKRVYVPYTKLPKVFGGMGISILSTPKGIVSGSFAKKNKIGGELICKVW